MKTLWPVMVYMAAVTELCWVGKVSSSTCEVYPSEYAYHKDSVNRVEPASANCGNYPTGLTQLGSEDYIHCNGTQLRLTDSDLGEEQYSSSYYYEWRAGIVTRQLLFIFPTRVNLTTITLHYYSDSQRGLPRLRFIAAPDDFDVWDAPPGNSRYADIAAVPPGAESAGRRNVSISVNFSTSKILMVKLSSNFNLAVSEVEFNSTGPSTNQVTTSVMQSSPPATTTLSTMPTTTVTVERSATPQLTTTVGQTPQRELSSEVVRVSISEVVAWVLVCVLSVALLTVLLTALVLHYLHKKRESRDSDNRDTKYEMEGNVCYEATQVKQTTDEGPHVYEAVKGGGVK